MSRKEWKKSLRKLKTSLDADIHSILKFSYDALDDEDKDLFLHMACLFNVVKIKRVEDYLGTKFLEVRQRLNVLAEKSLLSLNEGIVFMEILLKTLGREIVRKQSIHEPGQRQFLIDEDEIREVLSGEAAGSKNVIGIKFYYNGEEFDISERAFEGMSNLQFLIFHSRRQKRNKYDKHGTYHKLGGPLKLPRGLNYLSHKLRILEWSHLPMTCLPSTVSFEFLVELALRCSELVKLWEGIKPLQNLKIMDLSGSRKLRELPDLSTATNLLDLNLSGCISLIELPSSIRYAKSLEKLKLRNCSELIRLPSCIENATNLKKLYLDGCTKLLELSSFICKAINLKKLDLSGLPNLFELPTSIGNLTNLEKFYLNYCSNLRELPSSNGNLHRLKTLRLDKCYNLRFLPATINVESLYGFSHDYFLRLKSPPTLEFSSSEEHQ